MSFTITLRGFAAAFDAETQEDARKGKDSFLSFMGFGDKVVPGNTRSKPKASEIPNDIEFNLNELECENIKTQPYNEIPDFSDYEQSDTDYPEKF